MTTRSFGTTKQSPVPQHHSPAALRWPPREIQLSWAEVLGTIKARLAKISASRARLPNIGSSPFRCPGLAIGQITQTLLGSRIGQVAHANSALVIVDNDTLRIGLKDRFGIRSANQPLDLEV